MTELPPGYAQASRNGDPEQLSCKKCGATVAAGSTKVHTSWHEHFGRTVNEELTKFTRSLS